jgi:hypothetical protein
MEETVTQNPNGFVKLPTGKNYRELRNLVININSIQFAKVEAVRIWANVGEKERQHL